MTSSPGIIGGLFMYVIIKFFTYQLFPDFPLYQRHWPGFNLYT